MHTDAEIDQAMRAFVEANLAPGAGVDYSHGDPIFSIANSNSTRLLARDTGFPLKGLTAEQIFRLWRAYRLFRFEANAAGELIISPTKGTQIACLSMAIQLQLFDWHKHYPLGRVMSWGTFFTLPDHSIVMPQICWISDSRLVQDKAAPEFVIELQSAEEDMEGRLAWIEHLLANGTWRAWLIDPKNGDVLIFEAGRRVQKQRRPKSLDASPDLPGFCLDLQEIWAES